MPPAAPFHGKKQKHKMLKNEKNALCQKRVLCRQALGLMGVPFFFLTTVTTKYSHGGFLPISGFTWNFNMVKYIMLYEEPRENPVKIDICRKMWGIGNILTKFF